MTDEYIIAGAGSVLQYVIANNGRTEPQLFRGAIAASIYLSSQYNYNDRIPEVCYHRSRQQTILILKTVIFQRSRGTGKVRLLLSWKHPALKAFNSCTGAKKAMACLRSADATTLENANMKNNGDGFFGTVALVPVVDGEFIRQRASLALAYGKVNGVRSSTSSIRPRH
jgi:hypothetical protein